MTALVLTWSTFTSCSSRRGLFCVGASRKVASDTIKVHTWQRGGRCSRSAAGEAEERQDGLASDRSSVWPRRQAAARAGTQQGSLCCLCPNARYCPLSAQLLGPSGLAAWQVQHSRPHDLQKQAAAQCRRRLTLSQ